MFKAIIGVLLILAGIAAGLYVGLYVCLYGGIVLVVHGATAHPVGAGKIAFGIVRILLTSLAGWISVAVLAVPGFAFVASALD